jgi:hypothetical protein
MIIGRSGGWRFWEFHCTDRADHTPKKAPTEAGAPTTPRKEEAPVEGRPRLAIAGEQVEELFQRRVRNRCLVDSLIVVKTAPKPDRRRDDDRQSKKHSHHSVPHFLFSGEFNTPRGGNLYQMSHTSGRKEALNARRNA